VVVTSDAPPAVLAAQHDVFEFLRLVLEGRTVADDHELTVRSLEAGWLIGGRSLLATNNFAQLGTFRLQNLDPGFHGHFLVKCRAALVVALLVPAGIDLSHPGFCHGGGLRGLIVRIAPHVQGCQQKTARQASQQDSGKKDHANSPRRKGELFVYSP
jgi:hypothetical protein